MKTKIKTILPIALCINLLSGLTLANERTVDFLTGDEKSIIQSQEDQSLANIVELLEGSEKVDDQLDAKNYVYPYCKLRYAPLYDRQRRNAVTNFAHYFPLVAYASKNFGIPTKIQSCLILQESGFSKDMPNREGLGQVINSTRAAYLKKFNNGLSLDQEEQLKEFLTTWFNKKGYTDGDLRYIKNQLQEKIYGTFFKRRWEAYWKDLEKNSSTIYQSVAKLLEKLIKEEEFLAQDELTTPSFYNSSHQDLVKMYQDYSQSLNTHFYDETKIIAMPSDLVSEGQMNRSIMEQAFSTKTKVLNFKRKDKSGLKSSDEFTSLTHAAIQLAYQAIVLKDIYFRMQLKYKDKIDPLDLWVIATGAYNSGGNDGIWGVMANSVSRGKKFNMNKFLNAYCYTGFKITCRHMNEVYACVSPKPRPVGTIKLEYMNKCKEIVKKN